MGLTERVLEGDIRAAAKIIRLVEDGIPSAIEALKRLYPHTGKAHIVGITGPPGAGKSSLTDRLIEELRKIHKKVGVIAVDPTSPFSGGAILGDRIRMQRHSTDPEVFIKSLATRGHLGGLSKATDDVAQVMDAMGKDVILVETVGVGQDEVDIAKMADTTMVVTVPGLGDDIQTIKAGILEIADLFVVNKGDKPEADKTVRELKTMLEISQPREDGWKPPVFKVSAITGDGLSDLMKGLEAHRKFLETSGRFENYRKDRVVHTFEVLLKDKLFKEAMEKLNENGAYQKLIEDMWAKRQDPYSVVEKLSCQCKIKLAD
jgi:LAO/AO transport system kinase